MCRRLASLSARAHTRATAAVHIAQRRSVAATRAELPNRRGARRIARRARRRRAQSAPRGGGETAIACSLRAKNKTVSVVPRRRAPCEHSGEDAADNKSASSREPSLVGGSLRAHCALRTRQSPHSAVQPKSRSSSCRRCRRDQASMHSQTAHNECSTSTAQCIRMSFTFTAGQAASAFVTTSSSAQAIRNQRCSMTSSGHDLGEAHIAVELIAAAAAAHHRRHARAPKSRRHSRASATRSRSPTRTATWQIGWLY